MKKFRIWGLLLVLFLVGCGETSNLFSLDADPIDVNQTQIYYNPLTLKLIKFNPNGNTSEIINTDDSSQAYGIANADNYFIVGSSTNHDFSLMKIEGAELKKEFDFNGGEDIYPIGYNNGSIYFIHSFFENGTENKEKRTIGAFNIETKEITDIAAVKGLISDGVVSPNNIYYTVFNPDNNYHELHSKSIEGGKKSEAPELISVGYEAKELFLSKDLFNEKEIISLYASDKNKIYSKDDSWPKFEANYFKPTTVIGINHGSDETMELIFVDKRSREEFNRVDGVLGIRFEGDIIDVATKNGASKY